MIVTLAWPPSTNHLYVRTKRGVMLAPAVQAWTDQAIIDMRQSGQRLPRSPWAITIWANPPADKRRHDPDNICKAVLDAVRKAFDVEDSFNEVKRLLVVHTKTLDPGVVWVEVEAMERKEERRD